MDLETKVRRLELRKLLTEGEINHANLLNLNWADAGHSFDTDLDLSGFELQDARVWSLTRAVRLALADPVGMFVRESDQNNHLWYARSPGNWIDLSPDTTVGNRNISFGLDGAASTAISGFPFWVVGFDEITFSAVIVSAKDNIADADFIIDINLEGTTIYTTQSNRPTILIGSKKGEGVQPDVFTAHRGDRMTFDVDQGVCSDLLITLIGVTT